jgi:hypothetical protein
MQGEETGTDFFAEWFWNEDGKTHHFESDHLLDGTWQRPYT